jgi:glycosyltransferase involved in cell wall biosynthesis
MRILFLSQLIPYPIDAGPKVRSYHVLQYLASAGHDVTLVSFSRDTDRPASIDHLRQFCREIVAIPIHRSRLADVWHLMSSLLTHQPFLIARDWSPAMAQQLTDLVAGDRGFDLVHADQLWMAPFALWARSHSARPLPLVLDAHNAVFQIPQRMAETARNPLVRLLLKLEAAKMAAYEAAACRQFDHVATVTPDDLGTLAKLMTGRAGSTGALPGMTAIPICVDSNDKAMLARAPHARRVTFLGGLHWPPNAEGMVWFARDIWPLVIHKAPDAVLTVIGKDPPAELARIAHEANQHNFEITGYVPDPMPYLGETAAFIVPLRAGGGMRVKIIDAWSWGLPIVSTSIGAEGLEYQHGENLLIADTARDFAESLVRLLADPALADRISRAGRRTLQERYDWRRIYPAWDKVYRQATGDAPSR